MSISNAMNADHGEMILRDRLTFTDASDFRKHMVALFDAKVKTFSINLSGLIFSDSAGLGMLIVALNECNQRGIELTLLHPKGDVKALLTLTKSYERFSIVD
jgi:anti-anti-sigma factor